MWTKVAQFIIRYRLALTLTIGFITVFMAYKATRVEMSYDFNRTVPPEDPEMVFLNKFKEQFGEDGNKIAVGVLDSAIYELKNFEEFKKLGDSIRSIPGVNNVLSLPQIKIILKDTAHNRFRVSALFPKKIPSQEQFDSLMTVLRTQKFYMGQIVNITNGATMMLVSVNKEVMNSSKRVGLVNSLVTAGEEFSKKTNIQLRYAGLPFIRSVMAGQVKREMSLFFYLSAVVTGLIMFLFFRSFRPGLFSMGLIGLL